MDSFSDIRRVVGEVTAPSRVERQAGPPDGRATPSQTRAGASEGGEEPRRSGERSVQAAVARASRALGALDPGIDGNVGARLGAVREQLTLAAASGDTRAGALLERLDALMFSPGKDGGAALAALTQDGSLARQLALLAAAAVGGIDRPAVAQDAMLARLLVLIGASSAEGPGVAAAFSASLAELLGAAGKTPTLDPSSAAAQLRSIRSELLTRVAERLSRTGSTGTTEALLAVAKDGTSLPSLDGALARVLFTAARGDQLAARAHVFLEGLLAGSLASSADVAGALVAESGRADAGLREALGRYLAAREFEHSWNVARREFGDPLAFGFAVPDGESGCATVQLVGGDDEEKSNRRGDGGSGSFHMTLGVDFSGLGPIRADLAVRDDQIAVRLVVSYPQIAMEIRRRAQDLETVLGLEGRRVLLAIADGTEAQATVDARRVGVHEEDHVMDLEG